jgi:hypothetical protein
MRSMAPPFDTGPAARAPPGAGPVPDACQSRPGRHPQAAHGHVATLGTLRALGGCPRAQYADSDARQRGPADTRIAGTGIERAFLLGPSPPTIGMNPSEPKEKIMRYSSSAAQASVTRSSASGR